MDVCPLLDLMDGVANYTQHIRVPTQLQLTTRNLPETVSLIFVCTSNHYHAVRYVCVQVPGFRYMCRIGSELLSATRNNESSLTCDIPANLVNHIPIWCRN